MFGEADLRRAVARYLSKRELAQRDVVFVHLPDSLASQSYCPPMTRPIEAPRPSIHARQNMDSPQRPVRSYSRPITRPLAHQAGRPDFRQGIRAGAPHFIIWTKNDVLQVELKTTR